MAVQKPKASKADAYVAPAYVGGGRYPGDDVGDMGATVPFFDPCCIPSGVAGGGIPLLSNTDGPDNMGNASGAVDHIMDPTAH